MRILHVITTIDRGGAENHLLQLARGQRAAGNEVTVCFLKGSAELKDEFEAVGVEVVGPIGWRFPREVRASSFDLLHAHLPQAEVFSRILTLRRRNLIVSRHLTGKLLPRYPIWISRLVSRFVERGSRAIVAISHAAKNYLIETGHSRHPEKIQVIHYGYLPRIPRSTVESRPRHTLKGSEVPLRMSCIARLTRQKDLPTLIRSVAQLFHDDGRNVTLRIAGTGPDRAELESLCRSLGVENRVEFVGRITDPEPFILESDIFVLPSIFEGFGLVMLEAAAVGTPIVAAGNTSMLEVVADGVSGLLFDTGSSNDLTLKVSRLADDPSLQHALAIGARAQLDDKFNPDRMVHETLDLYQRFLTTEYTGANR